MRNDSKMKDEIKYTKSYSFVVVSSLVLGSFVKLYREIRNEWQRKRKEKGWIFYPEVQGCWTKFRQNPRFADSAGVEVPSKASVWTPIIKGLEKPEIGN